MGVEELLGIAMGCMGMTMKDFCQCAPSEFYAAWKAWSDAEDRRERGAWERMRMECVCASAVCEEPAEGEGRDGVSLGDGSGDEDGGVETPPHRGRDGHNGGRHGGGALRT